VQLLGTAAENWWPCGCLAAYARKQDVPSCSIASANRCAAAAPPRK